jgi:hypothetical protein
VTTVLYAIPAVLAALLGVACWRLVTLRRALIRERVVARVDQAASHRELQRVLAQTQHALVEEQVLAAAEAVIHRARAAIRTNQTNEQRGGTDA